MKQNTQSLTVVHNLLMLYLGRSQTIYLLFLLTIISVQSRIFPMSINKQKKGKKNCSCQFHLQTIFMFCSCLIIRKCLNFIHTHTHTHIHTSIREVLVEKRHQLKERTLPIFPSGNIPP
uniref:(northern house mosquito) hypothetical protein n=1 Tax=Culex pipiens TaxID=7175 RepID=A0A8D8AZT7_CULPI